VPSEVLVASIHACFLVLVSHKTMYVKENMFNFIMCVYEESYEIRSGNHFTRPEVALVLVGMNFM